MVKLNLTVLFICLLYALSAQSLKPIAQMVAEANFSDAFSEKNDFFERETGDLGRVPEMAAVLKEGRLLHWNADLAEKIASKTGRPLSLNMPLGENGVVELQLVPARNFSDGFEVRTASDDAVQDIDRGQHYWGIVKDDPNSLVTISIFKDEVMGGISIGNDHYTIGKVPDAPDNAHILYKSSDLDKSNPFSCMTDDELHRIGEAHTDQAQSRSVGPTNCVRMYVEADYTLFQNKGSVANVTTYLTGVFSQVSALYTNESINLVLHTLVVWDVADPYTGPSASNYLTQFRDAKGGVFNGDLAHLVGIHGLGGVAYLDVLCNGFYSVGYSSINATYSNVPTYSWTVEVLTHEIGHNLGSPHTHACAWNGNNTAIDGCGPTAGYSEGCTAALPASGTIMSYCHLVSGVGINFANGFGPQPGDRIRSEVYNAPCLASCGGGGTCNYVTYNTANFDANWGIWTDGGTDCARINNATYANSPTYSIQLRDNTTTSVMTTGNQNLSAYSELTVNFSYVAVSFENGEDFWLQISTNGGSTYTTIGDYNAGTQFTNGVRQSASVVIPGPFSSTTRLRFRADASADDDVVYIDDVVITGCQLQNKGDVTTDRENPIAATLEENTSGLSNVAIQPNPATEVFHIRLDAAEAADVSLQCIDLTGRVVMEQHTKVEKGENRFDLPVSGLMNGVYFLQLRSGAEAIVQKVLVQR